MTILTLVAAIILVLLGAGYLMLCYFYRHRDQRSTDPE